MPHTLFYRQTAGVRCQNNLRGDTHTHKYASHTACIFTLTDARPSRSALTYATSGQSGSSEQDTQPAMQSCCRIQCWRH